MFISFWNLAGDIAATLPNHQPNFRVIRKLLMTMSHLQGFARSSDKMYSVILKLAHALYKGASQYKDVAFIGIPIIKIRQSHGCLPGVGGSVRFLVEGTISQEEKPPRGQLWMEQCLTSLKYWPIQFTIWADLNYTWGLAILSDSLLFSVNNILAGLWLNYISSVEITLFLLADILLQHRALFQC